MSFTNYSSLGKSDSLEAKKDFEYHKITVYLQPEEKTLILPRPKTVLQLLNRLKIKLGTALVIRDGQLLTHDREILPDDSIFIRLVISSG